jgi:uncharacterized protein (TIGR00255 family)
VIVSMTGFGASVADVREVRYRVHIRSVNHRFMETRVRAPKEFAGLEHEIVARVKTGVQRGHIDVTVAADASTAGSSAVRFDATVAAQVLADARRFASDNGLAQDLSIGQLLAVPGVVVESDGVATGGGEALLRAVDEAVASLRHMRATEGAVLAADLRERLQALRTTVNVVEQRHIASGPERHARLVRRVHAILRDSRPEFERDVPVRIEGDVVALVERSDVTEELVRLRSHLDVFERVLSGDAGARGSSGHGKKLEFLVQEIGRELNTIGSKSPDADITQAVVDGKCELERIREQVSNLE